MARALKPDGSLARRLEGGRTALEALRGSAGEFRITSSEMEVGSGTLSGEGGRLTVRRLCIEPSRRGFGCGSEAAGLIVDAAERSGFATVRAWAPPDLGLAVYFWTRMGLRPMAGLGPEGGIWFERTLNGPGRALPGAAGAAGSNRA